MTTITDQDCAEKCKLLASYMYFHFLQYLFFRNITDINNNINDINKDINSDTNWFDFQYGIRTGLKA